MGAALEIFKYRLHSEWLPEFCNDKNRMYPVTGFKLDSINVSDFDANNFLRALDSGLVKDVGGGRYCCPKSATFEQIFWEGKKILLHAQLPFGMNQS